MNRRVTPHAWRYCKTHPDVDGTRMWGCPDCLAELRRERNALIGKPPTYAFFVPGRPVAKARPRVSSARGHALTYTPGKTKEFEDLVRWHAKLARVRPLAGDVALTLRFFGARGDADNCAKSCADALNGFAYLDDRQVVELHVYVARKDANPRTEIEIRSLEKEAV